MLVVINRDSAHFKQKTGGKGVELVLLVEFVALVNVMAKVKSPRRR